jgi:hypothetical protein
MDDPNRMQDRGKDCPGKIFPSSVNPFLGYAFIIIRGLMSRRDEEVISSTGGIHNLPGEF